VPRVDRRLDLDAVRVLEEPLPLRRLVAVDAADDAVGDRRGEVHRQRERVAHRQGPVADPRLVAVPEFDERERLALLLRQESDPAERPKDGSAHGGSTGRGSGESRFHFCTRAPPRTTRLPFTGNSASTMIRSCLTPFTSRLRFFGLSFRLTGSENSTRPSA